ncbi:MAG: DNA-directed RNA polymerase subunit L [Candidatus Diapherotrites archaeon]|nr:DNA-directed RNA polymerase subunit L [Candidatus Diapherotrites archaeon]
MELVFLENRKDSMIVELKGEAHTFPGLLCWALLKDPKVQVAVYEVPHPLVGTPRMHIKTKGEEPKAALKKALKLIQKELDSVNKPVSKIRASPKAKGKK